MQTNFTYDASAKILKFIFQVLIDLNISLCLPFFILSFPYFLC